MMAVLCCVRNRISKFACRLFFFGWLIPVICQTGYGENKLDICPEDHSFYTVSENNLPQWARQGRFCFLRLDGGEIEARKAELSNWNLSKDNLHIESRLYSTYSDDILEYLKEARINWIWITWSNGFSLQREAAQREECKTFLQRCHAQGIKVTAYMSASNMFWKNMFIDEPTSISWVNLEPNGRAVLYGDKPERYLADIANPHWRDYVKRRAQLALEAGFDAFFYDNLGGEDEAFRSLFSELQRMAEDYSQKTGNPKVIMLHNPHMEPERADFYDIFEVCFNEFGQCTPGVWDGVLYVENIRKIRYMKGNHPSWKPHLYDIENYHTGNRLTGILSPKEEKLSIAEAVSFGSALGRCIQGKMLTHLIQKKRDARNAWQAMSGYNQFIRDHENLYVDTKPVSHTLLLTRNQPDRIAEFDQILERMLIYQNMQYDVRLFQRLLASNDDTRYDLIVIPSAEGLTQNELDLIKTCLTSKGKILLCDRSDFEDPLLISFTEQEKSLMRSQVYIQSFVEKIQMYSVRDQIIVKEPYIITSFREIPGGKIHVLHVLNYSDTIRHDIQLRIQNHSDVHSGNIAFYTPDKHTALGSCHVSDGNIDLTLSSLDTYAVITILY